MDIRRAAHLSEHVEKQQEEADKTQQAFEKECQAKWTPADVRDQCCLQWLAHGPEIPSKFRLCKYEVVSSRGCSGGCLQAHPRIILEFKGNTATATLSHALDPLINYFKDPEATKIAPLQYQLNGLLSTHVDRLKNQLGSHLIKVSSQALAASQRSHERWLEQEDSKRQAKKRKTQGKAAKNELLESVLEICYSHSLLAHLDIAEIAWMRLSCKTMAKIAARLATARMQQIQLSYSVLYTRRIILGRMEHAEEITGSAASHRPLSQDSKAPSKFVPKEPMTLEWNRHFSSERRNYIGLRFLIFLEGSKNKKWPERDLLFSKPLEVARYRYRHSLQPQGMPEGVYNTTTTPDQAQRRQPQDFCFPNLSYKVMSNQNESHDDGSTTFKGSFRVESVVFTFEDLLGVYVRKKLPQAKAQYHAQKQKRPADKQYIKALAKAAREAPGNAMTFQGMMGW